MIGIKATCAVKGIALTPKVVLKAVTSFQSFRKSPEELPGHSIIRFHEVKNDMKWQSLVISLVQANSSRNLKVVYLKHLP